MWRPCRPVKPRFRVLACASLALLNVLNAICESWVALSPRSEHFEKSRARSPRREGREGELQSTWGVLMTCAQAVIDAAKEKELAAAAQVCVLCVRRRKSRHPTLMALVRMDRTHTRGNPGANDGLETWDYGGAAAAIIAWEES